MIQAVTAYGNPVPKAPFQTRSEAIEWAKENAHIWPGLKVVVRYPNATRTIWRDRSQEQEAA